MKKLISVLISIIIMAQLIVLPVSAKESSVTEYWKTMQSFGVVGAETNKNGNFTIADMSKMLFNLLNLKEKTEPEATHQIYTDVDRWHWAAGYIEWLYNNSVYTGDGSGVLEPERNAKLSDVCSVALNLLGYTKFMESSNDDTDVIKKAALIGLLSSDVDGKEHEVTFSEFASILYKMLFTDVMESSFDTKVTYSKGGEFITEVLELDYKKGIISGANGYSLNKASCVSDEVIIDGTHLKTNTDYSDYIGYCVKYYYDAEEEMLISAVPYNNEELILKSEDIVKYENNTYTIEEDGRKKIKKCEDISLLYNGKVTTNRNAFIPTYGQVRLIDNDNDGKFECIISEDAVNIIFEKAVDGIIYGKNADSSGKKYAIDINKFDIAKFAGDSVSLDELNANAIITAVISEDGEIGKFYISEKKISGILEGYDTDNIVVEGSEYPKAKKMYAPDAVTTAGSSVEISLDIYGSVASLIRINDNRYLFGYLISVEEDVFEEKLILKLLTGEGGVLRFYSSDAIYIDGVKMRTLTEAKNNLNEDEVIRYRVSNGEIRYIDTASVNQGFSDLMINSDRDSLTMIAKGKNMLYKSTPQIFKYYGTAMDVHSEFAVDDDTLVFFVPSKTENISNDDYYTGDRALLRNDLVAEVQAYVTSNDTFSAEIVVVKHSTEVVLDTKFTIVDKVLLTINEDDEIVGRITGLSSGKAIDVIVPDCDSLADIEKGSIIRYQTDKDGVVRGKIEHIYGRNGKGEVDVSATHSWSKGTASGANANVRAVLGYVQERRGTLGLFKFKDNVSNDELFNMKNCNVYVYDKACKEPLRNGTIDDLYDYAYYQSDCDEVVICARASTVTDVFIIRK